MQPRDVFVSYVEEDSATVLALTRELRALGHSTWTFEEDGVGGRSYMEEVDEAVSACPVFLLIASKAAVHDPHQILTEIQLAHAERRIIIPVLLDLTADEFTAFRTARSIIKVAIGTTVPVNGRGVDSGQLAARIHTALGHKGIAQEKPEPPPFDLSAFETPLLKVVETKCLRCDGTGKWASVQKPGKWNTCKRCNGTGRVKTHEFAKSPFGFGGFGNQ